MDWEDCTEISGHYEVLEEVGRGKSSASSLEALKHRLVCYILTGSYGLVYLATLNEEAHLEKSERHKYAIKRILPTVEANSVLQEMLILSYIKYCLHNHVDLLTTFC